MRKQGEAIPPLFLCCMQLFFKPLHQVGHLIARIGIRRIPLINWEGLLHLIQVNESIFLKTPPVVPPLPKQHV